MSKKVILLHPSLNAAGGGEQVALQFIRVFYRNEYEITLYTVEKTNWAILEDVFMNLQRPDKELYIFSKVPETHIQFIDSMLMTLVFIALLLYVKYTRREIQINTCGEKVNSISDIVYVNAIPLRSAYMLESTSFFRKILSRVYGLFICPLDHVNPRNILISNSGFNKCLIKKTLNRESNVIYPPIDLKRIAISDCEKGDCVAVGSRYLPEQGLDIVPILASRLKGVKFTLIGTASDKSLKLIDDIKRKCGELGVSDRVNILFNQPFSIYCSTLSASKVYLRPLPSESFGISIIEAMAAGCVPLVRRGSGSWVDILDEQDGKYGFSFDDADEAILKISKIVTDKAMLEAIQDRIRVKLKYFKSMNFDRSIIEVLEGASRAQQECVNQL
ncbi:MAG: glycosyltransferase [Candidatus Bathyarchaeota archaeon]